MIDTSITCFSSFYCVPYIHFYYIPLGLNGLIQCIFLSLSLNYTCIFNLQWIKSLQLRLTCSYWWCLTKPNTKLWSASPYMLQCDSRNWWLHDHFKQAHLLPQCCHPMVDESTEAFISDKTHSLFRLYEISTSSTYSISTNITIAFIKSRPSNYFQHSPRIQELSSVLLALLPKQDCWECKNETVMLLLFALGRMKKGWKDQWVLSDLLPSSGSS